MAGVVIALILVLGGSALFAWGAGWDVDVAVMAGLVLLLAGLFAGIRWGGRREHAEGREITHH